MSLPPAHHPDWPKVTLFDDPDEEARAEAMREALRNGTFDEAEPYLGTPPGFATLITDPPRVSRRYDSHGLESEDDGSGPFDGLKRYAALRAGTDQSVAQVADAPLPTFLGDPSSTESEGDAEAFDALKLEADEPGDGAFVGARVADTLSPGERMEPPRAPMESLAEWPMEGTETPPDMAKELAIMFGPAAAVGVSAGLIALWPALVRVAPEARRRLLPFLREHFDPGAAERDPRPSLRLRPTDKDIIDLLNAHREVLREPRGPANEPRVTLTDADLRDIIVARGGFKNINELEFSRQGWGLVKIIWKHGERSAEPTAFRVTEDDVVALPEILRTRKPIESPANIPERLNWVVERPGPDGILRKVVYAARPFKEDGKHRVVTIYVENPAELASKGHDPLPLSPDRAGGRRR